MSESRSFVVKRTNTEMLPANAKAAKAPMVLAEGKIKDTHLEEIAYKMMYRYGVAVNEDRSLPDFRDGLKPVHRRVLWAAYQLGVHYNKPLVKSARIVGETLGKYHPHGDQACYGSMVTMVNSVQPLLHGEGNWGSISDPRFADMRYTNARLSKFTSRVLFDPFYMPIIKLVPNYDNKETEPLLIPALLPVLFLNGSSGIGVGTRSDIPAFTLESMIKVLKKVFSGEPATPKSCMALRFTCKYGGMAVDSPDNKANIRQFFKDGVGYVQFASEYKVVDNHKIVFKKFAPLDNLEKVLERVLALDFVESANDESEPGDFPGTVVVYLKKSATGRDRGTYVRKVAALFERREQFRINITERVLNDKGEPEAKFRSSTVPDLLNDWAKWRTELEVEACSYQIGVAEKDIRRLEVLMIAVKHIDIILRALKKPFTDEQLSEYLAQQLKITLEEAKMILDLRVRQLKALELKDLAERLKEAKEKLAALKKRRAKPNEFIVTQLDEFAKEFSNG